MNPEGLYSRSKSRNKFLHCAPGNSAFQIQVRCQNGIAFPVQVSAGKPPAPIPFVDPRVRSLPPGKNRCNLQILLLYDDDDGLLVEFKGQPIFHATRMELHFPQQAFRFRRSNGSQKLGPWVAVHGLPGRRPEYKEKAESAPVS